MIKAYLSLIVLASVLCGACRHPAKSSNKGYVLSIDQDKIGRPQDSVVNKRTYEFVLVPIKLSNFTGDTLKYITMTCSWDVIFKFNKKGVSIRGWNCDSNFPAVFTIAPHKSFTYKIPVLVEKNAITGNYSFKIGMYLFKYREHGGFREFDNFLDSKLLISHHSNNKAYKNIIWSNEVMIPDHNDGF
jgi:hypothetical protein